MFDRQAISLFSAFAADGIYESRQGRRLCIVRSFVLSLHVVFVFYSACVHGRVGGVGVT